MRRGHTRVWLALAGLGVPLVASQLGAGCLPGGAGGVVFNLPPTPVIATDVVRGVAPLTVRFSSDGSTDDGLIVARRWDFGDGGSSQDISPVHTFTATGDFRVTLTLTDDLGAQASRFTVISVTEAPLARISVDRRAAENAPAVINFDATGSFDPDGEIIQYQWDFGDGSREFLPSLPHTYATPGTYRARLTVTDNVGVTGSDDVVISVGIPTPRIEIRVPPPEVNNIVAAPDSQLWVQSVFDVEPGVPFTLRAGLDGDQDACEAQTVVFNANNGLTLMTITGHGDAVNAAAFAPDGSAILTGSEDGTLRLHDAQSGVLGQVFDADDAVTCLAFGPNATQFVYGQADGAVVLRATASGELVRQFTGHAARVNAVAFSPHGDQILSGGRDRRAILWDLSSGQILRDFRHDLAVESVAFSPADPALVATGGADQTARIWNVTSGAELVTISGQAGAVNALAFSPDGATLLTGSQDGAARLWSVQGELLQTFATPDGAAVTALAFSPDGLLIAAGTDSGVGQVWDLVTGQEQYALQPLAVYRQAGGQLAESDQPCTSPLSAVDFAPDGLSVLAAVAAKNDIRLDTDPPNGNDLNLTYPLALSLKGVAALGGGDVPPGRYFLWTEIRTDRTPPQRGYAPAQVSVVAPYTSEVGPATPLAPLRDGRAAVLLAPTSQRQIFDLGPLSRGDRVFLSLLSTPAYGALFNDDFFSVMMLDANQKVFTWYQDDFILLTPDTKLVVGHNSAHYYVVVDSGDSVSVRVQRGFGLTQRQQRMFFNFAGATGVAVGGEPPISFGPLDASVFNAAWGDEETQTIKDRIVQFARDRYGPWNIQITTSDEGDPPAPPFQTVHFGGFSSLLFGLADYIDPRNDTLTGAAIIYTDGFAGLYNTPEEYGSAIGEVAVHESSHLLGLRHVDADQDIMVAEGVPNGLRIFMASTLRGAEQYNSPAIGIQDAPQWFDEIFGPAP